MTKNAQTTQHPPSHPFPFQTLPSELRNSIYKMLVILERPIKIDTVQPAITRVCRQLRAESLPIFYGNNIFLDPVWWGEYKTTNVLLNPGYKAVLPDVSSSLSAVRRTKKCPKLIRATTTNR